MKILCLSDTHNQHLNIPTRLISNEDGSIDTIIHAGDVSSRGTRDEVLEFLEWYNELPFKNKILISGNHDFFFEVADADDIKQTLSVYNNITYLNDSGVEIDGIKIWGTPVQPWFFGWAFNKRGEEIKKHWDMIPNDTDVLITHGPVKGILDNTADGDRAGCPYLYDRIIQLDDLKLHVCGHIHEAYGMLEEHGTTYVNASVLNRRYYMTNEPIVIEINK